MQYGGPTRLSLNEMLIRPVIQNMAVVALFIAPMLTMRLFAEERRQGTIELLATSPVSDLQVVLGKFLAASALYLLMILAGLVNVALIWLYADNPPEWRPIAAGALGLFLLGASFLAMGTFVSTLTRNQIVAGILSFCLFLGMWTLGWADSPTAGPVMQVVAYLGVTSHLEDLAKGVVDLKDIVFYLSVIVFGLFLAHQSVESQRWRA
jgi:ABC-2 type transport system permease protein